MTIIQQVGEYLVDNAIGTLGTDIFLNKQPATPNNCITIYRRAGLEPDRYLPHADPAIQILVRNTDYDTGSALVDSIVALFHQSHDLTLVSGQDYFYYFFLQGEPGSIGRDDLDRTEWSINLICKTRR